MTLFHAKRGRPKFFENPDELQNLFLDYIDECNSKLELPNMSGFKACKAISQAIILEYEKKEEYSLTFEWIHDILEDMTLNNQTIDSSTKKLILMSKFGYADKQQIDQRNLNIGINGCLDEEQTAALLESLRQKYLPSASDDDILK